MGDNSKLHRGRKVIILSRDASLARAARGGDSKLHYHCLRVINPYEAAAELLAELPLAMVIDLRCLAPGDLPLIEMARQRSLEVLAVGSVPLGITTTDLSGVRLAARDHLLPLLEGLAVSSSSAGQAPVSSQAHPGESPELSSLARSIRKASRGKRKAPKAPKTSQPAPKAKVKAKDKPPVESSDELLTKEELAALLEDES